MDQIVVAAQVLIAVAVSFVWIFRFDNIVREFREYGYPDLFRSAIGASKIALSTLLIVAVWHPEFALVPALGMAVLMAGAQASHFKVRHAARAYLPSLVLLGLSLFVAAARAGWIT